MANEKARPAPPPPGGGMGAKMGKQQMASLGRVLGYVLKYYKLHCVMVLICLLCSIGATLTGTLFMQKLIDNYITPLVAASVPDFAPLAQAILKLCVVLAAGVICSFGYNRLMVTVSQGTMKRLRIELFSNMESLPIRYFDTHSHGDIMSVYTNDVDTLRQTISMSVPQLLNSGLTVISAFVSMVVLCPALSVVSVLMVVVMLVVTGKFSGRSGRFFAQQQKSLGAVNGYIEEMMEGQRVVKVFCREEKTLEQFRQLNHSLREAAYNANRTINILMPLNANLGNISYVLCAVVGGVIALGGGGGAITIGTLVSFLSLSKSFTQPITQVSMQLGNITMSAAGAQRLFNLRDEKAEEDEGHVQLVFATEKDGTLAEAEEKTGTWAWKYQNPDTGAMEYRKVEGGVTFNGVDFGYTEDKPVLHDIEIYATPGQKIAFVGSTGAGKTTITNLINRFYDIQDGKIRYDGININHIRKKDLRRSLGMVLQDTHLFTGTVMDNIRYGRLDATDEECVAAAKLANADGFIRRLPQGYQTMLSGDGGSLSQGQRQLLSIARAAVADPPVLILDEATSSIDTRTEAQVQEGMDALMTGRTSFVIAHRLSTVRNSDCIMVMEQGRIIERGNHDQLMEKKGRYYQLYTGHGIEEE